MITKEWTDLTRGQWVLTELANSCGWYYTKHVVPCPICSEEAAVLARNTTTYQGDNEDRIVACVCGTMINLKAKDIK